MPVPLIVVEVISALAIMVMVGRLLLMAHRLRRTARSGPIHADVIDLRDRRIAEARKAMPSRALHGRPSVPARR